MPSAGRGKPNGMASNSRIIDVPREAVWAVLTDGFRYADWVVGTRAIRDVDADWPQPGSRLHYTVGYRPLRHDGHTEVLSVDPGRCLELEAHAWPFGSARITLRLEDADRGCRIDLVEYPARGSAALLHNPVGDALLGLRNIEALRRLERAARSRQR
jgi:uncharacterized protein YndB with AHSA1/START domain